MKYFVTYGYMDIDAGANPLGHAFILLSRQTEENAPIEVISSFGYYSQPSTTKNPVVKGLKNVLGFNVDLQHVHAELKQELMRHIEVDGLHGINFVTTEEKFHALLDRCNQTIADEQATIEELNQLLTQEGVENNGRTRYEKEKALAEDQNRSMRLNKFHVDISLNRNGLDSRTSSTCKTAILGLLEKAAIIDRSTVRKITAGATNAAFPRYSNLPFQPVRLVATGAPIVVSNKKNGNSYFNRTWENNKLYWATPLYPVEPLLSVEQHTALNRVYAALKNCLNRAHVIELQLRNKLQQLQAASSQQTHDIYSIKQQLQKIEDVYNLFIKQHENTSLDSLASRLSQAETTINLATIALNPNQVNYSFLFRAYLSMSMRHATLGILCLCCAVLFLPGAISVSVMAASSIYTSYKLVRFFKEEEQSKVLRTTHRLHGQTLEPPLASALPVTSLETTTPP